MKVDVLDGFGKNSSETSSLTEDLKFDKNSTRTIKNSTGTPENYYRATRDDLDDLHEKVSREVGKVGGKVFFPLVALLVLRAQYSVERGGSRCKTPYGALRPLPAASGDRPTGGHPPRAARGIYANSLSDFIV